MVGALLSWYEREARDLPWRRTSDPYAILVSEVMLQQTQVARVVERYEAWLEHWPTVEALAAARLDEVLRAWVGLGYNRRAVRLWEAARVVARDGWPQLLEDLPGIGPYTAAAVGAFAFGREELAVDTNVGRVLGRLRTTPVPVPGRAAQLNQALMELGATVCTARAPRCSCCPVQDDCPGPAATPVRAAARSPQRFEDTSRYVRGRIVAALAADQGLPAGIAPARLRRALDDLERDGLIRRAGDGWALADGGAATDTAVDPVAGR